MYILALGKRLDERRLPGHVRQDPQLYLRVICHDELPARRGGESVPDPYPHLGANRDVLQVGRVAGEAARRRPRLLQGAVYTALVGDELEQAVYVGALELGELAVLDNAVRDGVLDGELLQDLSVRRVSGLGLPYRGYAHLLEEDLA